MYTKASIVPGRRERAKALVIAALDFLLLPFALLRPRRLSADMLARLEPSRILLARPDHIGDAVLATPALRALRARFPAAHITFAVASWSAPLFRHNRDCDELLVVDPPWWIRKRGGAAGARARWTQWLAFARHLREIRRQRYDLCVELRGDVRQILAFGVIGGARHIIAYRRNGGHHLADGWLPVREDRHEAVQNCDLVQLVGCDCADPVPRIVIGDAERQSVRQMLLARGIGVDTPVLLVHPGAKRVNQWPQRHFRSLLEALVRLPALQVLLTGAPQDRAGHRDLEAVAPGRIHSLAGEASLPQLVALLERATVFLCADTGPMHLLNGLSTRSVLLFGPTRPERFAPLSGPHEVLRAGSCCASYLHDECLRAPGAPESPCMASIPVQAVYERVVAALQQSQEQAG